MQEMMNQMMGISGSKKEKKGDKSATCLEVLRSFSRHPLRCQRPRAAVLHQTLDQIGHMSRTMPTMPNKLPVSLDTTGYVPTYIAGPMCPVRRVH